MSEVEKSAGNSFDHSSQCGCLCGMCGVWEGADKDRICGSVMHQHGLQWNIRDITLCGDGVTGGTFKKICIILKFFRTACSGNF